MDTEKAKDLLEKSEHIGLLLPPDPGIDCRASAEVLARILGERGKNVGFFPESDAQKAVPPIFAKTTERAPMTREFIVSLDTRRSPVSQLRYEKHDDRVDIVLSPRSVPMEKESFSFRQGNIQCDLIVALGVADIEAEDRIALQDPRILLETPIINIDTAETNRRYGEANLVSSEKTSCAEIVSELLSIKEQPVPAGENATLLLAGIMSANECFDSPRVNAGALEAAAKLIGAGAAYPASRGLAKTREPLPLLQLASRAAVRSKESAEKTVLWSFLTSEDFEKTGRTAADMSFVLRQLGLLSPGQKTHALLWQDPQKKNVRAILQADAPVLETIAAEEPGSFQSPYFALAASWQSFQDAEERIASLLENAGGRTM